MFVDYLINNDCVVSGRYGGSRPSFGRGKTSSTTSGPADEEKITKEEATPVQSSKVKKSLFTFVIKNNRKTTQTNRCMRNAAILKCSNDAPERWLNTYVLDEDNITNIIYMTNKYILRA